MSTVKIAAVTDDGQTLSNHFGMATQYVILEAEAGRILKQETRQKPHHTVHPDHNRKEHAHSDQLHEDMFAPIHDCQVLLVGGMGNGAYQKAIQAGLEVVLTGGMVLEAAQSYLAGTLASNDQRLHRQ
jgi:predicted Fe-Mo cluster-binding NifX family protein